MKRILLSLALVAGLATGAQAQLLYKISGNGLTKPSYVVGYNRLVNPAGIVQQIDSIERAMTVTDQMYFETCPDSASFINETRTLPSGQTLKTVLTAAQYQTLDKFVRKYEGVGLDEGHVQKRYGRLTPLALKAEMEKLLFVANHMGEYDPTHTFVQYFTAQAKHNSEGVYGLNSVKDEAAFLRSVPMATQAKTLTDFISHEDAELGRLDNIAAAFAKQDVEAIAAAANRTAETEGEIADWAKKMPAIMQATPTLFVVEATKMGGEKGLLALLKAAGFTVE